MVYNDHIIFIKASDCIVVLNNYNYLYFMIIIDDYYI